MAYLFLALILIGVAALAYLLKLKLILDVTISEEAKCLSLSLSINRIRIKKYTLAFTRYGKGQYALKYYKNGKLSNTYRLEDLFEKKPKKKRRFAPRDIFDTLDMFFDKRRLIIGKLFLDIDVGLEDAAATALLSGAIISMVNIALARIYSLQGIPKVAAIHVKPLFGRLRFSLFLECILSIRLAYIIMAGLRISLSFLRKKVSAIASDRKHTQDDDG